ncbi:hypothetical protein F2Q69_00030869 [Brassica cretica]|uniref:Uncharacterized protein n=1 Tax=Brassica cretica TaxID=69181 RepID=A0A8S9RWW5_BRACR|nr:hypothetical protein F2Q69_00030869 [Brassica cretica]
MTFNQKVGYIGGTYMNGYYAQPQPQPLYYNHHHLYGGGRVMVGASPMMPLYTFYPYHQSQAIGFTQPSFTKPISTHPISGILSFYPKPYNPQPQPLYYNHHHLYGGGRVMVGASPMMPLYTFYPYHQSQATGFTQPSFTKPISTHPISGILSFYPKPYNVS